MTEADALARALEISLRGWGRVHPNPLVGAVVLQDGQIVGEGYHAEFGGPHAEAVALAAAGARARGATLVTTLEPCAHHGKQPPCADLIAAAGIQRVVVAMPDPNPIAAGGADRLRAAGVELEVGARRQEAEDQNAIFLHALTRAARPFVAVKIATSLDHRIADPAGHSRWISGDEARDWVHWFRAGFDAIGVGGRTALVDNPALTVRGSVEPRQPPRRVVFLGSRRLSLDSTLVRTAREIPTVAVVGGMGQADAAALLDRGVTLVAAPALDEALVALHAMGVQSMVVEGGGRLAGSLLAGGLVDRLAWIISPVWLGDHAIPGTRGFVVPSLMEAERWRIVERRPLGQDTLLMFDHA
ncbi:MAG: bifunctional diaminohydroxyphosphoribosylaminopyrimidine deaminase/5-amino-6-(5-phosphoribosylamino)uracil reductase RibD [Gemmatimonadales bacterium]